MKLRTVQLMWGESFTTEDPTIKRALPALEKALKARIERDPSATVTLNAVDLAWILEQASFETESLPVSRDGELMIVDPNNQLSIPAFLQAFLDGCHAVAHRMICPDKIGIYVFSPLTLEEFQALLMENNWETTGEVFDNSPRTDRARNGRFTKGWAIAVNVRPIPDLKDYNKDGGRDGN